MKTYALAVIAWMVLGSHAEARDPLPAPAYCYVLSRDERPVGHFSACFPSQTACLEGLRSREDMGTVTDRCESASAPYCAIAVDATGKITFRTCARDLAICNEQASRAADGIRKKQLGGITPTCRPATVADIHRPPS